MPQTPPTGPLAGTIRDPRDRLIVALDLDTRAEAAALVERLGDSITFYKIGYQLVFGGGLDLAAELVRAGKRVFVDMKMHDIGNTVSHGAAAAARIGATFLTVHAYGPTMRAALKGAEGSGLRILGVTVLTSWDDGDVAEAGYTIGAAELVARRAELARKVGLHGLVMSPGEVAAARRTLGRDMLIVTPGVRPAGAEAGDQKRVMTPQDALRAGADHLVVGRPITGASDPAAAARAILAGMEEAEAGA